MGHDSLVTPLALPETGLQRMVYCNIEQYIAMVEIVNSLFVFITLVVVI